MIVKCKCGQDKRVSDVTTPGSTYRCGKCREKLHLSVTATGTPLSNTVQTRRIELRPSRERESKHGTRHADVRCDRL